MGKFFLTAAILLSVVFVDAQSKRRVMAVGFYNLENLFHPTDDTTKNDEDFTPEGSYHYTYQVYQERLRNMANVLGQLATDVTPAGAALIGIAEVENDKVLSDLVQQPQIKERNYQYVWFPTPDVCGISTALLYNPRYFRLISAKPVKVPLETVGQSRPTRNILFVEGVLAGNDTVYVMVNHWPSRSGGVSETMPYRELAASVCRQLTDSLMTINPDTKVLIMGDLNDNPNDASIRKVMNAKADTTGLVLSDIYNPWINVFKKGSGTEVFDDQWNLFDQIMLSAPFLKNNNEKWRYHSSRIFRRDFLLHESGNEKGYPHRAFTIDHVWDNGYSDHLPVVIFFVQ
ncbi:MAG: endonuclease [Chitinophagaceae bacterium]|nr:endonuclease [Chitinophagaceae bacterium]